MATYDTLVKGYENWFTDNPYWLFESTRFFEVIGDIKNKTILELACGTGRHSRIFMELGAQSVVGTDISGKMIGNAIAQNTTERGDLIHPKLSYQVLDAVDPLFTVAEPVDMVTAVYLFFYASSLEELTQMVQLVSRNLKPNGRFVAYTFNPDYDFAAQDPQMKSVFGYHYPSYNLPHAELKFVTDEHPINTWVWSKSDYENALKMAGLGNIQWHSACLPKDIDPDVQKAYQWYIDNPDCIVLSATKLA